MALHKPKSDAERLIQGFLWNIAHCAFRLAPERADDLGLKIMGEPWKLHFVDGVANFKALPTDKTIQVSFAALQSLWSVTTATFILGNTCMEAQRQGKSHLIIAPGSQAAVAFKFWNAAAALIRNPKESWPENLMAPDAKDEPGSDQDYIANLFLAAAAFVVLHEVAHIHLGHNVVTTLMHQQEHEADAWAIDWALEKVEDPPTMEFRTFAIVVAFLWIGLIDEVRRGGSTHPHASERIAKAFYRFRVHELSPALEIGSYALKAFFDPHSEMAPSEDAGKAFAELLLIYSRRDR